MSICCNKVLWITLYVIIWRHRGFSLKRARQLRWLGGHSALLSLKLGGSSLTPGCLHSSFYLLDRLVAFVSGGFWLLMVAIVFIAPSCWFWEKFSFDTWHCCSSYSRHILRSQSATADTLTWHLVHHLYCLLRPLEIPELSSEKYDVFCPVITEVSKRGQISYQVKTDSPVKIIVHKDKDSKGSIWPNATS